MNNLELLPENITANPVWADFAIYFEKVMATNVDSPLQELSNIRNLTQKSDPVIIRHMIRMLGFDVTHDFMVLNNQKVINTAYMFSQFYQNNFNNKFPEFISFVLGRTIRVNNLYSQDYVSFYRKPHGQLVVDGGEWYKTTHIDVSIDMMPDDLNGEIITAPDGSTQDRIMDLFYEFCPINLVVKNVYFTVDMVARFVMSAAMYENALWIASIGGIGLNGGMEPKDAKSIEIVGPTTIYEEGVYQYRLVLVWELGDQDLREPICFYDFDISNPSILRPESFGRMRVLAIRDNTTVRISAEYAGHSTYKDISVIDRDSFLVAKTITIEGPSRLPEQCDQDFAAYITWNTGETLITRYASNLTWTSSDTSVAYFNTVEKDIDGFNKTIVSDGKLTVNNVDSIHTILLTARFSNLNGTVITATKEVEIVNSVNSRYVSYILIQETYASAHQATGHPDLLPTYNVLDNNKSYQYNCYAHYSDGTVELIYPRWNLSTTLASISNTGLITVENVPQTLDNVILSAEYTYKDVTYYGKVVLKIRSAFRYIDRDSGSYVIIGPDSVLQHSETHYVLMVKWVDQTQFVEVKPDEWQSTKFVVNNGTLKTGIVEKDGEAITIQANFFFDGVEYRATKSVFIYREVPVIKFIDISGDHSMREDEQKSFLCFSYWSDKARKTIESTYSEPLTWSVRESFASIQVQNDASLSATVGTLVIDSTPTSTFVTVQASYTTNSVVYTATHYVAIAKLIKQIESVYIVGPDSLIEFDNQRYECWVKYQNDANTEKVNPVWSVRNVDVNIDDVALVNTAGDVHILRNDVTTSVLLEAQFYRLKATKLINIDVFKNQEDAPPDLAWIEGMDIVPSSLLPAMYTMWTQYTNASPVAYGADWSINVSEDVAVIDSDGALQVFKFQGQTIEITATRIYGYATALTAKKVVKIPNLSDVKAMTIDGADILYEREDFQYKATAQFAMPKDVTSDPNTIWKIDSITYPEAVRLTEGLLSTETMIHPEVTVLISATLMYDGAVYTGQKSVALYKIIPTYGISSYGKGNYGEAVTVCINQMPSSHSEEQFTINVPTGKYGYFLHPEELGYATFVNITKGKIENWNGAKWSQTQTSCQTPGWNTDDCGPIIVTASNGRRFYLYRTDEPGIGQVTYQVNYLNA